MDSLADVLSRRERPEEPEESRLLKTYVLTHYKVTAQVAISDHRLTLVVPNAALAGTLQLELPRIKTECRITKKLYIRIG